MAIASRNNKRLSDRGIEELLTAHLGKDYSASSEKGKVLKVLVQYVSDLSDVLTLAELLPSINTFISTSRSLTIVSAGSGFLSILLFPVGALISAVNAYEKSYRFYAYRSIAYTTTAWAFDKPIPASSPQIISNVRTGWPVQPPSAIPKYHRVWQRTSVEVLRSLRSEASNRNVPEKHVKILFQALGDGDPRKLCEGILRGYEDKFSYADRMVWKSNYSIKVPH